MDFDHLPASGTLRPPENIIAKQLAGSLPALLDKSVTTLEKMLEASNPEIRLRAATLIIKAATQIATLKR